MKTIICNIREEYIANGASNLKGQLDSHLTILEKLVNRVAMLELKPGPSAGKYLRKPVDVEHQDRWGDISFKVKNKVFFVLAFNDKTTRFWFRNTIDLSAEKKIFQFRTSPLKGADKYCFVDIPNDKFDQHITAIEEMINKSFLAVNKSANK